MVSNGAVQGGLAMWIRSDWRRRSRAIIALTLIVGVAGIGLSAAIAIPAYHDYSQRVKAQAIRQQAK